MSKRISYRSSTDSPSIEESDEDRKVAAACTSCGSIYASERSADGTVRPIGRKDGCQCGASEFEVIRESNDWMD